MTQGCVAGESVTWSEVAAGHWHRVAVESETKVSRAAIVSDKATGGLEM